MSESQAVTRWPARALGAVRRFIGRSPLRISIVLLSAAIVFAFVAWQVQAAATRALDRAREIQLREVAADDSPPPTPAENREVLEVLGESIAIRQGIDDLLGSVERTIRGLQRSQDESRTIAITGRREVDAIAGTLGGTVAAARSSLARLTGLRGRLQRSSALAHRIAEELEELDHKLGPTVARPRP